MKAENRMLRQLLEARCAELKPTEVLFVRLPDDVSGEQMQAAQELMAKMRPKDRGDAPISLVAVPNHSQEMVMGSRRQDDLRAAVESYVETWARLGLLPIQPRSANKMLRSHWAKTQKYNRTCADVVALCIGRLRDSRLAFAHVHYHIVWKKGQRRLDEDNALIGLKPVTDALVKCGWLVNDSPRHVRIGTPTQGRDRDAERTQVEVWIRMFRDERAFRDMGGEAGDDRVPPAVRERMQRTGHRAPRAARPRRGRAARPRRGRAKFWKAGTGRHAPRRGQEPLVP